MLIMMCIARRIGENIAGVAVKNQLQLNLENVLLLAAVGQEGKRNLLRELVSNVGYEEGVNFFCVC